MKIARIITFLLIAILLILSACNSTNINPTSTEPFTTSAQTITPPITTQNPPIITSPLPTTTASPTPTITEVEVTRVIDGDTIEVNIEGSLYRVRYIGIDTPELNDTRAEYRALAEEAMIYNRQLVEGKIIKLTKDISEVDKYGRLLRYVYVDSIFVNAELVAKGFAWAKAYEPDIQYQDYFTELETKAKQASLGVWKIAPLLPPTTTTPQTTTPPTTTLPNVKITRIFYDGLVPRVESDEYVEITNLGVEPVHLKDWVLKDISDGYPSFTFPSYELQPNQSIRVYTNEIHPEYGGFSFGYGKAIWNNTSPDTAALFNAAGQEVSRKSY